jgi:hypothetical protein
MYAEDTPEKWADINQKLSDADYVIISSNRQYGSLTGIPLRYPQTYIFYQELFNGRLNFVKVAEFTSRPRLPLPGVSLCLTGPTGYGNISRPTLQCGQNGIIFVDDFADESWTVYDHPKVTIFKRK